MAYALNDGWARGKAANGIPEFEGRTADEISKVARDRSIPTADRRRAQTEEKARRFATDRNEKVAESYTRIMARWPHYRLRTWLREHLPVPLAYLFPAGSKDCGHHEWFRNDEHTDICWHCTVGEREHIPQRIDPESRLWQALNQAARAGSSNAQEIVDRMIAEDEEALRIAQAR